MGEGAKVVLEGQQVLPARLLSANHRFQYTDIESALRSIVRL